MALIFPRLAQNFARNGYFPTDEGTLSRILSALAPSEQGGMRILDPCAGEGVALAECKHHLGASRCEAHAVEYDEERAWHAKTLVDACIHGDFFAAAVKPSQYGLLFHNPPYGDSVADQAQLSDAKGRGRQRLEKRFYEHSNALLQTGGVMVLIVPHYVLDAEFSGWIGGHFERVRVFRAMVDDFRQVVIFGVRRRQSTAGRGKTKALLEAVGRGEEIPRLPEQWTEAPYVVPPITAMEPKFHYTGLDARQLAEELAGCPSLWDRFPVHFAAGATVHRRPATAMRPWHLALGLAAGQISGEVKAEDGRVLIVQGHTRKEQMVTTTTDEEGDVTITRTDRFVPEIRAWDFTPGQSFGELIHIS